MKKILLILLIGIPIFGFGQVDSIRTYHENGKLKSKGVISDGKLEGLWKNYYEDGKEELAFAKGDVSMMVSFSYSYANILNYIELLENNSDDAISKNDIYVTQVPQIEDPDDSNNTRVTYSSYFAETVSRNTEYPELAWDLLLTLTEKESLDHYFEKTHKPTSRRDMIEDQQKETTYGVFASQIGFAESFPIVDYYIYKDLFSELLDAASLSSSSKGGLVSVQGAITALLPEEGLVPAIAPKDEEEEEDEG